MKVMLDSNTCIFLMSRKPGMIARVPLHECGISSVVLGELECGFLKSDRRPENRGKLNQLLGAVDIYEVGEEVALVWAELQIAMKANLTGPNDMWIAAHALALDVPLITNNVTEFSRVPNLLVDDWLTR